MAVVITVNVSSPPVAAPASSASMPPPSAIKWEVRTDDDKWGNKTWIEYPKEVAGMLERMYMEPSTREDAFHEYTQNDN